MGSAGPWCWVLIIVAVAPWPWGNMVALGSAGEPGTRPSPELHGTASLCRKLCCSAFSLSEDELLQMRQEVHGCFAQMDRSLALPKIRARVLLQRLHSAWREAEFLKLDQALATPAEPQVGWTGGLGQGQRHHLADSSLVLLWTTLTLLPASRPLLSELRPLEGSPGLLSLLPTHM